MAAVAAGYEYATVRARKVRVLVERGAAVLVSAIKNGRLGATNKASASAKQQTLEIAIIMMQ